MAMDAPLLTPGGGASLSPSDGSVPAIAVVIIDAYTAAIKPAMNGVLIATAFTGAMFPLLVALFLFSSSSLRRKPIFIACVIDVLFNMVGGSLAAALQALAILRPFETSDILFPAAVFITTSCIVSGSILMLRLVAVYPPAMLSWSARLVVYGPPIALKVTRITNNAIFLHLFQVHVGQSGLEAAQSAWRLSGTRIELALQMVDNSYMSLMFLYKLWRITRSATTTRITTSYIKRIRTLIWIASSNFMIPCFLSLAQIIFVRVDSSFYTGSTVISLFLVNTFVETTGALLATIWAASNHWQAEHSPRSNANTTATYSLPTIRDLKASSAMMESRSEIQDSRAKPIVGEGTSSVVTLPEKVVVISSGEHKLDLDPSRPIV